MTRTTIRGAAIAAACLSVAGVATALAHGGADDAPMADNSYRAAAGVAIGPMDGSGVKGTAFLVQKGRKLTGWVSIWGLAPGSVHEMHIHGPAAKGCASLKKEPPHLADLPKVKADANGVAFVRIKQGSAHMSVDRKSVVVVHKGVGEANNPMVGCGDIAPLSVDDVQ